MIPEGNPSGAKKKGLAQGRCSGLRSEVWSAGMGARAGMPRLGIACVHGSEALGASQQRLCAAAHRSAVGRKKIVYTSRFVRVILAQGPC